jgi:hypothetical protein
MTQYEMKRRSFADTLSETFKLYRDNFRPLFLISLIISVPIVLAPVSNFLIPASGTGSRIDIDHAFSKLIAFIVNVIVNTIGGAMMIEYIARRYKKQDQSLTHYIQDVTPIIFPILGLSLIQVLLSLIALLVVIMPYLILIIFPVIYASLALSMAPQALIIERKGMIESINRSVFLTQDNKLRIFGYMIVYGLFFLVAVNMGVGISQILERAGVEQGLLRLVEHMVYVLVYPINACLLILVYFNLKIDKEKNFTS